MLKRPVIKITAFYILCMIISSYLQHARTQSRKPLYLKGLLTDRLRVWINYFHAIYLTMHRVFEPAFAVQNSYGLNGKMMLRNEADLQNAGLIFPNPGL